MRYPPEHKAQSREQLVEAARQLFRAEGFARPSIDRITGAAGLTRGAFYAHFPSKGALVSEVLALEPGLIRDVREASDRAALGAVLHAYLRPDQRADVLANCAFAAHPIDVRRAGEEPAYEQQLQALVGELETKGVADALDLALAVLGGVVLAGAVHDPDLADAIEARAAARVDALLGSA